MEDVDSGQRFTSTSAQPLKETFVLAASVLFVYTPFQALKTFQSSLNQEGGTGVTSLACLYAALFVSSFLTPAIMHKVGVKFLIVAGLVSQCVYIACNFYPHWASLIPGSVLLGFAQSPWWISVMTYLAALADVTVFMDTEKKKTFQVAFSRLNGIYSLFFVASGLPGGLVSSLIFSSFANDKLDVSLKNASFPKNTHCGVSYCPSDSSQHYLQTPDQSVIHILLLCFLCMGITGLCICLIFLPDLQKSEEKAVHCDVVPKLKAYWSALKTPRILLCIPVIVSNTMNFSLRISMFTEAYISCALGIQMVGYFLAIWGLSAAVFSGVVGFAARLTGRQPQMLVNMLTEAAMLIIFLLWRPKADQLWLFILLAIMMGASDAVWIVQLNNLVACLLPQNKESAMSVKATWSSLILASAFAIANILCPGTRITIALVFAGIAVVCYVTVEWILYRELNKDQIDRKGYSNVEGSSFKCSSLNSQESEGTP